MKKFQYNSPVVISFFLISFAALVLGWLSNNWTTASLFSVYRSSFRDPFTYIRLISHVLGHADLEHFFGNMLMFLVIGPASGRAVWQPGTPDGDPIDRPCLRPFANSSFSQFRSAGCKRYCFHAHHAFIVVRYGGWRDSCYPDPGGCFISGTGTLFHPFYQGRCSQFNAYYRRNSGTAYGFLISRKQTAMGHPSR